MSVDQMLVAVQRQQLSRVPIGRLAIERGKMSMSQVFEVLKEQADNPKSFGQLAIAMNFLTEEELGPPAAHSRQPGAAAERDSHRDGMRQSRANRSGKPLIPPAVDDAFRNIRARREPLLGDPETPISLEYGT